MCVNRVVTVQDLLTRPIYTWTALPWPDEVRIISLFGNTDANTVFHMG